MYNKSCVATLEDFPKQKDIVYKQLRKKSFLNHSELTFFIDVHMRGHELMAPCCSLASASILKVGKPR